MARYYRTTVLAAGFLQDSVAEYLARLPVGAHVGSLKESTAMEHSGIQQVCLEPKRNE